MRIFLLLICVFNTDFLYPQVIEYKDFINYYDIYQMAHASLEKGNNQSAINYFHFSKNCIEYKPLAYIYTAQAYFSMGKRDLALAYVDSAFMYGYIFKNSDSITYKPIIDKIIESKQKWSKKLPYDINLKNELFAMKNSDQLYRNNNYQKNIRLQDSIDNYNINRLREIVKQKGWPGRKILGYGFIPDASLLVAHSSEKDNLFFLKYAMESAYNNESSWNSAHSILQNLLWRFTDDGYVKLRHIFLKKDYHLDLDSSFFLLKSLSDLMIDNPRKIELFACYYDEEEKKKFEKTYQHNLSEIRDFLIKNGINANLISINPSMRKVKSDGFDKYYFGFLRYSQ